MKLNALLLLLLLCLSFTFAKITTLSQTFDDDKGTSSEWKFTTGLKFEATPECTLVGGKVLSGSLCNGTATVCINTVIDLNSNVEAQWANSGSLSVLSPYPWSGTCEADGDCPQMQTFIGSASSYSVKWMTPSAFDEYDAAKDGYATDFTYYKDEGGIDMYNALGSYHIQPVSYRKSGESPIESGKKGNTAVYCRGNYEVKWGSSTIESGDDPTTNIPSHTLAVFQTGTQTLSVSLKDMNCFASSTPIPVNDKSSTKWFRLYLYGYPTRIFSDVVDTETLNVVNIQPGLTPDAVDLLARNGNNYLIRIHVVNDGDVSERVTSPPIPVSKPLVNGFGATVIATNSAACKSLFPAVPVANCPDTLYNGFDSYFGKGISKSLYVIYSYRGTVDGQIIQLNYDSPDPTCSDATSWSKYVGAPYIPPENYASRCEITPASNTINPYEIHQWNVGCFNASNKSTPCVGSNWQLIGINGEFLTVSNTNALAYSSDSSGKDGSIRYSTTLGGQAVSCSGNISVKSSNNPQDPYMRCVFDPSSAQLDINQSQGFNLSCTVNNNPQTPQTADYALRNGLSGSLVPYSVSTKGVTYTGYENTSGRIRGIGWFPVPSKPTFRGAVAFALVGVNEVPVNPTAARCEITPASNTINPYEIHQWNVACFDASNKSTPCVGSAWLWGWGFESGGGGFPHLVPLITGEFLVISNDRALAYSNNEGGKTGIIAYSTTIAGENIGCSADVIVRPLASPENPFFNCLLDPNVAQVNINQTQGFNLTCSLNSGSGPVVVRPLSTGYNNVGGLIGQLRPYADPTRGVNFTGTQNSTGRIRAIGWYIDVSDLTLRGGVAFAAVDVGNFSLEHCIEFPLDPNCTCIIDPHAPGCEEPVESGNDSCKLFPEQLFAYPGYSRTVAIKCGDDLNESCSGVDWGPPSGPATINLGSDPDTSVQVRIDSTAKAGDEVTISAVVNAGTDIEASCELKPIIGSANCLQLS
ncbi:MAG: hypothetical protein V1492_00575 [Candidatus Micrarchaeota archaeon]